MPEDCLLEIFSYLSAEDLAMSVRHVDTRWMRISQRVCLWRSITFTPAFTMSEEDIVQHLQNMPNLWSLRLCHQNKTIDKIVTALCRHCVDVRCVVTERKRGPSLQKVGQLLEQFPNIEHLEVCIPGSNFSVDYAKLYGKLNKENSFTFSANMSSQSLSCSPSPTIRHHHSLDMSLSSPSEKDIIKTLQARRSGLEAISLTCNLTSNVLNSLSLCKNLKYLFVCNENSSVTEIDFQPLTSLSHLETLQLLCMRNLIPKWDVSYQSVEFPRLVKLEIVNAGKMLQNSLRELLNICPELRYLNVQENAISDCDLITIHLCKHLIHLDISQNFNLSNKCLEYVARGCCRLQFLDISCCFRMTDNIFNILGRCKDLQTIIAEGNSFTGRNFQKIPSLFPCLQEISFRYCEIEEEEEYDNVKRSLAGKGIQI